MSALNEVLERLVTDPGFRQQLKTDPAAALSGYSLTEDELKVLASQIEDGTGNSGSLEERTSKSALIGMLSGLMQQPDAGLDTLAVQDETEEAAYLRRDKFLTFTLATTTPSEEGDTLAVPQGGDERGILDKTLTFTLSTTTPSEEGVSLVAPTDPDLPAATVGQNETITVHGARTEAGEGSEQPVGLATESQDAAAKGHEDEIPLQSVSMGSAGDGEPDQPVVLGTVPNPSSEDGGFEVVEGEETTAGKRIDRSTPIIAQALSGGDDTDADFAAESPAVGEDGDQEVGKGSDK